MSTPPSAVSPIARPHRLLSQATVYLELTKPRVVSDRVHGRGGHVAALPVAPHYGTVFVEALQSLFVALPS
jgi:hypothetical protein